MHNRRTDGHKSDYVRGEKGMLEELFGNATVVKVLDFLLENRFWDYTKKDIAVHSGISRVQLYRVWSNLEKLGLVKPSRKIGATTLYVVNMESPVMKRLSELSVEIADQISKPILEEELTEKEEETEEATEVKVPV